MLSGIKIVDLVEGTGLPANRDSLVVFHVRGTLNRGDVFLDSRLENTPVRVELGKRDCIAGLRYGIVGMKVGGRRELVVSPHLGYGIEGLPGKVPSNAILRFEVELLEVRKSGTVKPEDYSPGKHLYFFWPGEANRNCPRIQFGLEENGHCGVLLTIPQPKLSWRYAKHCSIEHHLVKEDSNALFDEVATIPQKHPSACLNNDSLWADQSEKTNSVTRDSMTNTACITIGIIERGVWLCYYSLRENDPVLLQSNLYCLVKRIVAKYLPQDKES